MPTILAYFTNNNYISTMGKSKDMYMFYHQLMNIDDIYLQQEYLLNEQENDENRIYTESTKESLQQAEGSTIKYI
ncbi:MAG: hypothetical protein GOVbin3107_41 [Prokaryotic dsDNA virus sp.]|nr:MAG: hypothetical protein GOVbin3107_41 [Prokaryotic dsDNA virus sp.]